MTDIVRLIILIGWISGLVIAKGFWSTLFAIIPFYAWYLAIERMMQYYGVI